MELRKAKKDDMLSKRRNVGPIDSDSDTPLSPLQEQNRSASVMTVEEIGRIIGTSEDLEECYLVTRREDFFGWEGGGRGIGFPTNIASVNLVISCNKVFISLIPR